MSVNKYQRHVLLLPEDDANRQLAIGFLLDPLLVDRRIDVLEVAGGWTNLLDHFRSDHVAEMNRYPERHMVLLLDFDERQDRLDTAKAAIADHLVDRVFVLGVWSEPEDLRPDLGSYETIGQNLAKDCREDTNTTWDHPLLRHNGGELDRLRERVRPFLFRQI